MTHWETTAEDVSTVLTAHDYDHNETDAEHLLSVLSVELIAKNVLYFTEMENQIESALSDIEERLIELLVIPGPKRYGNYTPE